MIQTYEKVGFTDKKSGICPTCQKRATRSKQFYQTINPWNRKTHSQIMEEERKNSEVWQSNPTYHSKCEPRRSFGASSAG